MQPPPQRAAVRQTRSAYAKADEAWRPFSCPGTAECCQLATTSRPPWLWPSEWWVVLDTLERQGRSLPSPRADGGCPLLDATGTRCTVYGDRPLGCRTFFCHRIKGPARQPLEVMNQLLARLARLNRDVDEAAEPRALPDWLRADRPTLEG